MNDKTDTTPAPPADSAAGNGTRNGAIVRGVIIVRASHSISSATG